MTGVGFTLLLAMAPAPPDIVAAVQEIEVDVSTEEASVFRLRLGIAQNAIGDWTLLMQDFFRPLLPVSIRVMSGSLPEALINGYVSAEQVTYGTEPGTGVLEVSGMDATLLMNLQEKAMAWPNMPDHAIAAAIYGQYALIPRVQPTPPQLVEPEGTTTQRGTDIRFVRRLAARNGFECYVAPEALSGVDMGFFQPPQVTPGPPQAVLNVHSGTETNVVDFRISYEMVQPTTALGAGLDVATKAVQPALAPVSLQVPLGVEPALARVLPPPIVRPVDTGLMRAGELQPLMQAIADASSWALVAEGRVSPAVGILRPGGIVNVRGAGRVFSGSYYVTRVSHVINDEGHTQTFRAKRNAVTMTGAELFIDL